MKEITFDTSFVSGKRSSYNKIARLHEEILSSGDDTIKFTVNIEKRLGLPLLFYISTLPFLAESRKKTINIHANKKTIDLLKKGGYIDRELKEVTQETNLTPFLLKAGRQIEDFTDIFEIVTAITFEAPITMSDDLATIFISKVGEMFNNALEHSSAKNVIGAKYYKNQPNVYCFSCYDTGVGIPSKVFTVKHDLDHDVNALKWAMKRGNSTAIKEGVPRGLGLGLLQSFAKANDGVIRICTGKALYIFDKSGAQYFTLASKFEGTLFEMDIVSDNNHEYVLK